jgi:hypothetical protein
MRRRGGCCKRYGCYVSARGGARLGVCRGQARRRRRFTSSREVSENLSAARSIIGPVKIRWRGSVTRRATSDNWRLAAEKGLRTTLPATTDVNVVCDSQPTRGSQEAGAEKVHENTTKKLKHASAPPRSYGQRFELAEGISPR